MNHNTNNVEITLDYRVIPVGGARDIRGKKFGRITILERIERPNRFTSASGLTYWLGECECGDVGDYVGGDLTRGHTKSCGCMRNEITSKRSRSNLVGKVYGRLKVKKLIGSNKLKKLVYLCVCSCGKKTKVVAEDIISGHTQSCGCIQSVVMSGGSFNYVCYTIENELEGEMEDEIMNELVTDFAKVAHDLEWWKSADYGEEDYRKTVKEFKDKWFNNYSETHKKMVERAKEKAIEEIRRI